MNYLLEKDILESWYNYELAPYDIINLYQYGYISEDLMNQFLELEEVQEAAHVYLNEGLGNFIKNAAEKVEDAYYKHVKKESPLDKEVRKSNKLVKDVNKHCNGCLKTIKDNNNYTDDLLKQNRKGIDKLTKK